MGNIPPSEATLSEEFSRGTEGALRNVSRSRGDWGKKEPIGDSRNARQKSFWRKVIGVKMGAGLD